MSYWNYGYPEYVPVWKKQEKARKILKKLLKKNPDIKPVVIEGNSLAKTWWGKAWNKNLESYSDYSNRLPRGRTYVRHGCVLDLQIKPGKIDALVQGTRSNPYKISISIKPLADKTWNDICKKCSGMISSLQELLEGRFPKELTELFTEHGKGLFPSPREINLDCSCLDWAKMCKHVSAALYGTGSRLDEDPSLFFTLRKVDMNELISRVIDAKSKKLLRKKTKGSKRIMDDKNISKVFGIDVK